jgi:GTPase
VPGTWLLGHRSVGGQGGVDGGEARSGRPRAVLLSVLTDGAGRGEGRDADGTSSALGKLARLADTDGLEVVGQLTQVREHPDAATYIGSGKVEELTRLVDTEGAEVAVVDGELSPAQVRNLEDRTGVRVVDRTALILDIFAEHARSAEGKAQVELAQLAYQLPRLRRPGQELSRVGGGRVAAGAASVSAAPVSSGWSPSGAGCGSG